MGQKRKQISKATRFEVFKRDSFKCQYCGRSAPDVILEVDHIVPVSKGGENDILNLVTSCRDCNRGKGAKKLDDNSAVVRQKAQLDDLNARREQTEMLIRWKSELIEETEMQVNSIEDYFRSATGKGFSEYGRNEMKRNIRRFGFSEVYDAVGIAVNYYTNAETAFNKVGGICFNRKKSREET